MTDMLDFSSLERAVNSLARAVERTQACPDDEELRDAVIQRFEYTYELAWKMIKRQVELEAAVAATVDAMSFKQLIREAAEKGIVDDFGAWMVYREQRNITSHTYDADKATSVYHTAVEFLDEARGVLAKLQGRSHD